MSDNISESKDVNRAGLGLPLKITGIVFWGMALLGIVASIMLIGSYNSTLKKHYSDRVQSTAYSVSQIIAQNPDADMDAMRKLLEPLVKKNK